MRTTVRPDPDVAAVATQSQAPRHVGVSRAPAVPEVFTQRTVELGLQIDASNMAEALELLDGSPPCLVYQQYAPSCHNKDVHHDGARELQIVGPECATSPPYRATDSVGCRWGEDMVAWVLNLTRAGRFWNHHRGVI